MIPALNEETNLPLVLEGLPPVDEVVIVDGGSADDTVTVAREVRPDAVVVRQTRTGKGNALICGFAASRGDIVVTLNADGSTDPGEIPRYIDALISGAEVAHGSRYREGGGNLVGHRLDRLGNALLSRLVNALFGTRFTDLGYGYNAYWRVVLPMLDLPGVDLPRLRRGQQLWGDGPEIEPMINIRVAAQGMRVVEVASIGYPPISGARKRRMLRRALRALRAAAAEYARRWRIGRPVTSAGAGPRHGKASGPATHLRAARGTQGTDTSSHPRFTDTGQDDWRTSTGGGRRRDWRETTDTGQWQDLTGAAQQNRPDGPRYDPAAAQQQPQHDLDPTARRSLPMYPDPSWTEASGRHAEPGVGPTTSRAPRPGRRSAPDESEPEPEPDRRHNRSATSPTPWAGSTSDGWSHHRTEPDSDERPRSLSGRGRTASSPTAAARAERHER